MAQFDASIKLLVEAQQALKQVEALEKRLAKLQNAATKVQLRNFFAEDAKAAKFAEEQRKAFKEEKQLAKERSQYTQRDLRLKNATELISQRNLKLERAGALEVKERAKAVKKLNDIAAANPTDPRILERVATSLGRIQSTQNELNRANIKDIGQKQRIADYNKQIEQLQAVGATEGQLRKIRKRSAEFTTAAAKRQTVIADKRELQLKREIKLLERKYELELKAFKSPKPILSSQLRPQSVLGSDEALRKKAEYYERINKAARSAASPIKGSRTLEGSPIFLEEQAKRRRRQDKEFESDNLALMRRIDAAEKKQNNDRLKEINDRRKADKKLHDERLARLREFDRAAADVAKRRQQEQQRLLRGVGKRLSGALGGGLVGAGFPALFGASQGEIAGGGIGGVLGGLLGGPGGGFTGSIIGSAIGKLVEAESVVKKLAQDLGFAEDQTLQLAKAFQEAGVKGQKGFKDAVTALSSTGLSLEDQIDGIRAATELTKRYGGNLDKTAKSIANVFNAGKVSVADLNRLQSQGIPIQQKLAEKLGISRKEVIQLAKDGTLEVKTLSDAFTELAREAADAPKKSRSEFELLSQEVVNLGKEVGNLAKTILKVLGPAISQVVEQALIGVRLINRLISGGAQLTLTREAFNSFFAFGTTPKGIDNLEASLKGLSATAVSSKAELDELERVVNNYAGFARGLKGKAGERSVEQIQPEILRLRREIEARRKALGVEGAADPIGDIDPPFQLDPPTSGGRAAKERESQIPALERELALKQRLAEIQGKLDQAVLNKDQELAIRLRGEQELARLAKERGDIQAEDIPTGEKILKLRINELAASAAIKRTEQDIALLQQQRAETVNATVRGYTDELALLAEESDLGKDRLRVEQQIADIQRRDPGISFEELDRIREAGFALAEYKDQLRQVAEQKALFEEIAMVIGRGITDALLLVIRGTENLGDALKELGAQILETIGQMLILKAIEAGVNALSSSLFPSPTPTGKLPNLQLAEGGFVTRPTTALVAEGGQPEYVIPASKMTGAMNRFNAGASGDAVINGADPTGETNITGAADIPITISTGPVMQFEGKNYVSQEEFAAGIKLAAKEGEAATLRRLRMSPSTRRKVGL